ncbi:protein LEG1 homolog [Montipora capricornis]|uniref:protein LEG1 homolog n=1 Tax=Montipora capricornis TaxID=246305 RepID=UPI0035F1083A
MIHIKVAFLLTCIVIRQLSTYALTRSAQTRGQYPPGWQEAPDSFEEFPRGEINNKTKTIIDPWVYLQRIGIFKLMLIHTQRYFNSWGYNNTGSLLWGLPLQFGWQMSSGRLHSSSVCPDCVSTSSWWADMNYYLSVLPFLGALEAGVFTPLKYPIHIAKPRNVSERIKEKFCTSIGECLTRHSDVIQHWSQFFKRVMASKSPLNCDDRDSIVSSMWKAHTTSLQNALPLFTEETKLLSIPERKFGEGWALLVEFIAATHYQTNHNNTADFQVALPPRILHTRDQAPFIKDFNNAQNRVILVINLFHSTNSNTKGLLLKIWRRVMCSPQGRAIGRDLMVDIINDPWIIPLKLEKLLLDVFKYPC